ncbi:hypothetical protein ACOSP7_031538 [Xanthoceras sorbifolium]
MKRSGLEDNKSPSSSTGSVGGRPSEEQRLRIRKGARRARFARELDGVHCFEMIVSY